MLESELLINGSGVESANDLRLPSITDSKSRQYRRNKTTVESLREISQKPRNLLLNQIEGNARNE